MIKKIVLFLLLIGISHPPIFGQVVTPSLDQTIKAEAGTATSWRYFDSVGVSYEVESKTEKEAEREISTTDEVVKQGNVVLFSHMFGVEFNILSSQANNKNDLASTEIQLTEQNIFLSYRFNRYFALAVETFTTNFTTDQEIEFKRTKMGLGTTARMAKYVFLACGLRNVKSTGTTGIKTKTENSWEELYYGSALILGTPGSNQKYMEYKTGSFRIRPASGSNQLRLEYAMITSPEKRKDGTATTSDNHHQKTERALLAVEAKWGSFLFHYRRETITESALSFQQEGVAEKNETKNTIGFAFVKDSSFTAGIYQTTGTAKSKIKIDSETRETTTNSESKTITLGMTF